VQRGKARRRSLTRSRSSQYARSRWRVRAKTPKDQTPIRLPSAAGPLTACSALPGDRQGKERQICRVRAFARTAYSAYAGLSMVGTPRQIADEMEAWLTDRGSDGFNIMFSDVPAGLDVNKLIPELQRRKLFRTDYKGSTLREHLDLPRPGNRFFDVKREPATGDLRQSADFAVTTTT
jgi:alkanesulfonate monooxygenase SsuD/methylene tetrahydromethanopterin reductase-like flavin-dependent oxidoreductase (luciferase family)